LKPDSDFTKHFDLEPTEYRREEQPEPFLGYNGWHFLILFTLSFPIGAVVTFLVTGDWPYWLRPLLG
jgi:hypothetical protein